MFSYLIDMILLGFYGFCIGLLFRLFGWIRLLYRFYGRLFFSFCLDLRQEFRGMRIIGVLRDQLSPEATNSLPVPLPSCKTTTCVSIGTSAPSGIGIHRNQQPAGCRDSCCGCLVHRLPRLHLQIPDPGMGIFFYTG